MQGASLTTPYLLQDIEWIGNQLTSIERAILITLAYADIFDYPLTTGEIHRYLVEVPATEECVQETLQNSPLIARLFSKHDEFYSLRGREEIASLRTERRALAARLWPPALRFGHALYNLPFVRMVAVTGALAVENVGEVDDIDYLIITEPDRLWLARAWCILIVRMAALQGYTVCPNYFLSTRALETLDRSLYSAHELVQMIPLGGYEVYQQLRRMNSWVSEYLPNAMESPRRTSSRRMLPSGFQRVLELPQRSFVGDYLENWEMKRKITRFSNFPNSESQFKRDLCKGHFGNHGQKTIDALRCRLEQIGSAL